MLPAILIPLGVLQFMPAKPGADRYGPAPGGVSPLMVILGFLLATLPWLLMVFGRVI